MNQSINHFLKTFGNSFGPNYSCRRTDYEPCTLSFLPASNSHQPVRPLFQMFILSLIKPSFLLLSVSLSVPYPDSKPDNMHTANSTKDSKSQDQKCIPCESLDTSSLLTAEKAREELSKLTLWKPSSTSEDNVSKMTRNFTAKHFQSALDAINDIGKIAEREGHHPDLLLASYRDVTITLYTHSVGGLTQNDLSLAKMIDDEVKILYSPKWLKENTDAQSTAK